MKKLIISLLMLSLASCAFDKDKGITDGKELQDRQKIEENNRAIIGTYAGTMTTPSRVHEVELSLFQLEIKDGTLPSGLPKVKIELRALYKKLNPVGPDVTFEARFIRELGQLILTPISAPKGADDITTVDAKLIGQRLTGKVKSISGDVGFLDVSLVSKQQDIPEQGAESDYNDRLRRQFEKIVGEYSGVVIPDNQSDNAPFAITIRLNITVDENHVPFLTGELNYPFDRTMDQNLTVTYRPEWTPPRLAMVGKMRNTSGASNYQARFDVAVEDGALVGTMSSTDRISEGTFRLTKKVK